MRRNLLVLVLWMVTATLMAQEHQRLAATPKASQSWTIGIDGSLTPGESAWWSASLATRLEVEWARDYSLGLAQSRHWRSDPVERLVSGDWDPLHITASWGVGPRDLRLITNGAVEVPWVGGGSRLYSGELGLRLVRDPVILGASVGASLPESGAGFAITGALFYQEVANDTLSWSWSVSPRVDWYDGIPFWSLGVGWRVAWWQGVFGCSSGLTSAAGVPWTWSGSAESVWNIE